MLKRFDQETVSAIHPKLGRWIQDVTSYASPPLPSHPLPLRTQLTPYSPLSESLRPSPKTGIPPPPFTAPPTNTPRSQRQSPNYDLCTLSYSPSRPSTTSTSLTSQVIWSRNRVSWSRMKCQVARRRARRSTSSLCVSGGNSLAGDIYESEIG